MQGSLLGVGTDIVEVERIASAFADKTRLKTAFTALEIAYFEKYQVPYAIISGHFAAKEAVAKALGIGFSQGLGFHDIEISHDNCGKPLATLSSHFLKNRPDYQIHLSISHEKRYAVAFALVWQL